MRRPNVHMGGRRMHLANHIEKSTGNSKLIFAGRVVVVSLFRDGWYMVCYEIALSIGLLKTLLSDRNFRVSVRVDFGV